MSCASSKRAVNFAVGGTAAQVGRHCDKLRSLPSSSSLTISPVYKSQNAILTMRHFGSLQPPSPFREQGTGYKWRAYTAVPVIFGVGLAMGATIFSAYERSKDDEITRAVQCSSSLPIDTNDPSSSTNTSCNITSLYFVDLVSYLKKNFLGSRQRNISVSLDQKDTGFSNNNPNHPGLNITSNDKQVEGSDIKSEQSDLPLSPKNKEIFHLVESSVANNVSCKLDEKVINNNVNLVPMPEFDVSVRALRGGRLSMEDTYCVHDGGRFAGVFDGHGGASVSRYTSETIYDKIEKFVQLESPSKRSYPNIAAVVKSISAAFDEIEDEVLDIDEFQYQGSTAVTVYVHEDEERKERTIVSANVGDSRAVLSHKAQAIDLTRDHKPDDVIEKSRILAMGETIEWDSYSQVSRVKSLSLSRAIGDRFAKPVVSGEVEIKIFPMDSFDRNGTEDDFIILASDGLWDVMTSQNCVDFVNKRLNPSKVQAENMSKRELIHQKISRRQNMSRFVANEAVRRGSCDNICVVIIWLHQLNISTSRKE